MAKQSPAPIPSALGDSCVKKIPLTQGQYTLVDDEDYEWAMQWKWCAVKRKNTHYAVRQTPRPHRKTLYLHREILTRKLGCPLDQKTLSDHINHNGLDNTRANLRPCNALQNARNRNVKQDKKGSQFLGVREQKGNWSSVIWIGGKNINLGTFSTEIEAARQYDAAARHYFGEFANTNFQNVSPLNIQSTNRIRRRDHSAKLKEEEVKLIRYLSSKGVSNVFISKMFRVTRANIYQIVRGKSWEHI